MKSELVIREYIKLIDDNDIILVVGDELCASTYKCDRPNILYFADNNLVMAIALGLAYSLDNKIQLFIPDTFIQSNVDSLVQAGISKRENLFITIFRNYTTGLKYNPKPILVNLLSYIGFTHNIGFVTHNYTPYFKTVKEVAKLKGHMSVVKGPSISFIDIDVTKNKTFNINPLIYKKVISINDRNTG